MIFKAQTSPFFQGLRQAKKYLEIYLVGAAIIGNSISQLVSSTHSR
jgi:hypothetical protein